MKSIRFTLKHKFTKRIFEPDIITFHKYGHFAFEVFREDKTKSGTDEDFDITYSIYTIKK